MPTQTILTLADVIQGVEPDYEALLVYSDFLEDQGDVEGAVAVRWICACKKWPYRMKGSSAWWHWVSQSQAHRAAANECLPEPVLSVHALTETGYWGDLTGREPATVPPVKTVQWLIRRLTQKLQEGYQLPSP